MSDVEKAYRVLELEMGSSLREIREAHRDLSLVWDASRFDDNPQLKKKALDGLVRIDEAYQFLLAHHSGAQTVESEQVKPTARPEKAEKGAPSLYEEIFRGGKDASGKRFSVGGLIAALVVVVVIVGYWILPDAEDEMPRPLSAQAEGPSALDESVENTPAGPEDLSSDASGPDGEARIIEATGDLNPPAPPLVDVQPRVETQSQPQPESFSSADPVDTRVPAVEPEERAPADKPVLQREAIDSVEEPEEPAGQEVEEDEGSAQAFEILQGRSEIARQLIEGGAVSDLSYQAWETVRRNPPEFWIDVVAHRSADGGEVHLIWSVNTETGVVRALSQAARDLEPEPSPDSEC
jgi:hypothetical protein